MISLLTNFGCSKNSTDPTPVNPNGPGYARAWESESRDVCFWVSEDNLSIVPDASCDDAAITFRDIPAIYTSGELTTISLRYTEQISIRNSKFSRTNYKPDPEGSTFSFEVTFTSASKATGIITEVNRYGVTSVAAFEAIAYLSTID